MEVRVTDREGKTEKKNFHLMFMQQPGLGETEVSSQGFTQSSPMSDRGPDSAVIFLCLFPGQQQASSRVLGHKWSSKDRSQHSQRMPPSQAAVPRTMPKCPPQNWVNLASDLGFT